MGLERYAPKRFSTDRAGLAVAVVNDPVIAKLCRKTAFAFAFVDEPLIENGVMTSLQTVELVTFLEDEFGITVEDEEFDEENFGSVDAIAALVEGKAA